MLLAHECSATVNENWSSRCSWPENALKAHCFPDECQKQICKKNSTEEGQSRRGFEDDLGEKAQKGRGQVVKKVKVRRILKSVLS